MVALAVRYDNGPVLMRDVASGEGISEKYLGQIILPLKAGALVVSQRGTRGGYSLARPPQDITVLDVVEAIEGPVAPVPCADPTMPSSGRGLDACGCERLPVCVVAGVWRKLADDIRRSLSGVTLLALARQRRESHATVDYVI
jgi:Rrf2 family protein